MASDGKVGIGIVGVGFWGNNLVRNFYQLDACRLNVLCDLDKARLDRQLRLYGSARGTRDASELIASTDVDAVVICTPPDTHYDLAARALEAGKHVFVSKPLTTDPEDARRLVDLAARKGRLLHVDHTFLYAMPVRKMKELISDAGFGALNYIEATRTNSGLFQPNINVVWDLGPHDASILNYLLERLPRTVVAHSNRPLIDGYEHLAYATLHYDNGLIAHLKLNWLSPFKSRRIIIGGTKCMVVFDESLEAEKVKLYRRDEGLKSFADTMQKHLYQHRLGDIYAPFYENREPLAVECAEFAEAVLSDGETMTSGSVGYDVVRLIDAIDRSVKSGGRPVDIV